MKHLLSSAKHPDFHPPAQLWCLHGNLQTPTVWDPLQLHLQQVLPTVHVHTENLWETLADSCAHWADQFCQRIEAHVETQGSTQRFLLGYSLGGRLALHAVLQHPHLWAGAIIVAADPGLTTGKAAQLERDRTWSQHFLTEPLPEVLADWNQLPLFAGKPGPRCHLSPYRQAIAAAFIRYSKGQQTDLRSRLKTLQDPPVLYVTGSQDLKYRALGEQLAQLCPSLQHRPIANSGHRVPWDKPGAFHHRLVTFLNKYRADAQSGRTSVSDSKTFDRQGFC